MMNNVRIIREKARFVNAPDDVYIHRGFQDALYEFDVIGQIEEQVMQMINEDGEMIVSGHSLGGATGHILAVYFADKYPNMKVTMINIGAPRLGNRAFKTWSEELPNLSAWRYVFRRDIVPRAIPTRLGYHHAGHLFQMHRTYSKVYYRQKGDGEQYARAPMGWYYGHSFSHHKLRNILNAFEINWDNDKFWSTTFVKKSVWNYIREVVMLPIDMITSYVEE